MCTRQGRQGEPCDKPRIADVASADALSDAEEDERPPLPRDLLGAVQHALSNLPRCNTLVFVGGLRPDGQAAVREAVRSLRYTAGKFGVTSTREALVRMPGGGDDVSRSVHPWVTAEDLVELLDGLEGRKGAFLIFEPDVLAVTCAQLAALYGWPLITAGGGGPIEPVPSCAPLEIWRRNFVLFELASVPRRKVLDLKEAGGLLPGCETAGELGWLIRWPKGTGMPELTGAGRRLHEDASSLYRDRVTGLYSRAFLEDVLVPWLETLHVRRLDCYVVDVDDFSAVNNFYGHVTGDRVLRRVAQRLERVSRLVPFPRAWCMRWGGDEFLCLVLDPTVSTDEMTAQLHVQVRLRNRLVTACIGASSIGEGAVTQRRLAAAIKRADMALLAAKREGKARSRIHEAGSGPR